MDYDTFKTTCFVNGIDAGVIEACREFVLKENGYLFKPRKVARVNSPNDDLGYHELGDINTVDTALTAIKDGIWGATFDFDSLGRSIETLRLKQIRKQPGKFIERRVLKAYFLMRGANG